MGWSGTSTACPTPSAPRRSPTSPPGSAAPSPRGPDVRRPPEQSSVGSADKEPLHGPPVPEGHPPAHDPVDRPESRGDPDAEGDGNAHERDEEHPADREPEEPEPERADLPAEVRLEVGA